MKAARTIRRWLNQLQSAMSADTLPRPQDIPVLATTPEQQLIAAAQASRSAARTAMLDRHRREHAAASEKAAAWRYHRDWLNADASLSDILSYYAKEMRMRLCWFPYDPRWPQHSNMYRWVGYTGERNVQHRQHQHTVIANQPELTYRKLLRWKLRSAGISEVRLHWVESSLNDLAWQHGGQAVQDAARVHAMHKGRHTQDYRQDNSTINPETALGMLETTHVLELLK